MSSLSNLPYGKILDYWYERLDGHRHRKKFILTKMVEVFTFKSQSGKANGVNKFVEFPDPIENKIPERPKITVVIPVYVKNEEDERNVKNLLSSLHSQSQKPDSVIIVDDLSVRAYNTQGFTLFKLDRNSGPATARNVGKQIALDEGADIIAFIDSDCIADPDWLKTISRSFLKERKFNILSGNTLAFDDHWFGVYHNINGTLNGRIIKGSDRLLYGTTANLAITAQVAERIQFNEDFPFAAGEDIEFCFKANMEGFAIGHIKQMLVMHNFGYEYGRIKNLKKFRNLFKKYGAGERILLKQVPNYYVYFDKTIEIPVN